MSNPQSPIDDPSASRDDCERCTIAIRRKELAEMIGRLLAHAWLDRHRAAESRGLAQGGANSVDCS